MHQGSSLQQVPTGIGDKGSAASPSCLLLDSGTRQFGDLRKVLTEADGELFARALIAFEQQDRWKLSWHMATFERLLADWPRRRGGPRDRDKRATIVAWLLNVTTRDDVFRVLQPRFGWRARDERFYALVDRAETLRDYQCRERGPEPRLPRVYSPGDSYYYFDGGDVEGEDPALAHYDILADGAQDLEIANVLDFERLRREHEELYVALLTKRPDSIEPSEFTDQLRFTRREMPEIYAGCLERADGERRRQNLLKPWGGAAGPHGSLDAVTRAVNRKVARLVDEVDRG